MIRPAIWLLLGWVALLPLGGEAFAHGPQVTSPSAPGGADKFPISFGGPFSLIDQKGQQVTDKDFRGRFLLVFFGYTTCPDICPTNLQTMADALNKLGGADDKVQPVFISVDPGRDRPEALADYVGNFHPRLIGLTGSEKQVSAVARAYRIHRGKIKLPDMKAGDYLVTHTPTTFLMGPDGKFLTLFPHDSDAGTMAKVLGRYLSAKTKS